MGITLGQIAANPSLRTRVLAGGSGSSNEVTWAHVCELPAPTEWLSAGELLMTVGMNVPGEPADQASYIGRLSEAGIGGLLICEQMYAPPITDEMLGEADRLGFPVLLAAYEVPFTEIARTVAEANREAEHERLLQIIRLYETVRSVAGEAPGQAGSALLDNLESQFDCNLYVVSPERGHVLLGDSAPNSEVRSALKAGLRHRSAPLPAILRLELSSGSGVVLAVPAARPAALIAVAEDDRRLPDLSLLHHMSVICSFELERVLAEYERRRHLGAELLASLLDERIASEAATHLLLDSGLAQEPRVLACCNDAADGIGHQELHLRLEERQVPHLLLRRETTTVLLMADNETSVSALEEECPATMSVGVSNPLTAISRIPDAYREAVWALESGAVQDNREGIPSVVRYDRVASTSPFLPRSIGESRRVVEHMLGPVIEYDAKHDSHLLVSLKTFLEEDRSWKRAADALHVHKQTLIYRMKRVEELTDRRLNHTASVCELWLALQALRSIEG